MSRPTLKRPVEGTIASHLDVFEQGQQQGIRAERARIRKVLTKERDGWKAASDREYRLGHDHASSRLSGGANAIRSCLAALTPPPRTRRKP